MKTPVAVTLIIMGALLVMTPALSDYLHQRNVVSLMQRQGTVTVTLHGVMSETYRFGCWFTGSAMIGIAVLCSLLRPRAASEREHLATQAA